MPKTLRYLWAFPNTALGLILLPLVLVTRGRARRLDGVLELHGGAACYLLERLPIAGGADALTLGHVVIARDRKTLAATRRHERVHVRQYEWWGPFFIPAYLVASLWALVTGGDLYHGNFFERDAVRRANRA